MDLHLDEGVRGEGGADGHLHEGVRGEGGGHLDEVRGEGRVTFMRE